MVMTAVMGHLLEVDFPPAYRKWNAVAVVELFGLAVSKTVKPDMREVADNISQEARAANVLVIWTDCDLEGENIGAEIATIAQRANPRIQVRRARFSVVQPREVQTAWNGLVDLDLRQVAAVDARSELDLRIGAAFTRLQTLQLKARFSDFRDTKVISYGSCQFPTLGFIVDRYLQVQQFIPEPFWSLAVFHDEARFTWARRSLFDRHVTLVLYEACMADPTAHVTSVNGRPTSKWAPLPLTTVEMMKASASILRLPSDRVMHIAEALYNQGIISYPRTETDVFDDAYDLQALVRAQLLEPRWSGYAQR
jgi:DNA topoisomerase-3